MTDETRRILTTMPFTWSAEGGEVRCRYCGTVLPLPAGTSVVTYSLMADTRVLSIDFAPESGWDPLTHQCGGY
jgi:hypothetical protein